MEHSQLPEPRNPVSGPAEELSASYAKRVGQGNWELDIAANDSGTLAETETSPAATPPSPAQILEALLFIGGSPLTPEKAITAIRGLHAAQFTEAIAKLNRHYRLQGRPYSIQSTDQGYFLALRGRFKSILDHLYGQKREAHLSSAAIDVLSLVAYRQPVTKHEVDGIRGLDSGALLRQLVRRRLVTVVRRGESGNREVCYGTTARFLELFRLGSLDDLPQTQDLQKL
jgi:segregation and condensation protein B